MDNIYLLAEHLDLNPNELLNKRLTIQDESIHEVNSAGRRVGGKLFEASFVVVKRCVKWIMVICLIYLVISFKDFELKMGDDPEQYELIEDMMINAINEYTNENLVNEDRDAYVNSMPPLKRYKDMKDKELYNSWKKQENTIDGEQNAIKK